MNAISSLRIQDLPRSGGEIGVLFAIETDDDHGTVRVHEGMSALPEVCAVVDERTSLPHKVVTSSGEILTLAPLKAPIILCNYMFFLKFRAFLYGFHAPEFTTQEFSSDQRFIQFVDKVNAEPGAVVARSEEKNFVSDDHVAIHIASFLVFVLAHELYHIDMGGAGTNFSDVAVPASSTDYVQAVAACANYEFFRRNGLSPYGTQDSGPMSAIDHIKDLEAVARIFDKSPSRGEHPPIGGSPANERMIRQMAEQGERVWRDEVAADKYGEAALLVMIKRIRASGESLAFIQELTVNTLAAAAFFMWYSKLSEIAQGPCATYKTREYFLTRCLCADSKKKYRAIGSMFSATHPPMYLRIIGTLKRVVHTSMALELKALKASGGEPDEKFVSPFIPSTMWYNIVDEMTNAPMKLAHGACLYANALNKALSPSVSLIVDFPALEGLVGKNPLERDKFHGEPSTSEFARIQAECP